MRLPTPALTVLGQPGFLQRLDGRSVEFFERHVARVPDVLHADWRNRGAVVIDVQWGKHGSLPHGITNEDPMWPRTLGSFWVSAWIGLPDIWLGRITRRGPMCFCHGFAR